MFIRRTITKINRREKGCGTESSTHPMISRSSGTTVILRYKLLGIVYLLYNCVSVINAQGSLFDGRPCQSVNSNSTNSRCFLGIFGAIVHRVTENRCRETCAIVASRAIESGWECGPCANSVNQPASPPNKISSPTYS